MPILARIELDSGTYYISEQAYDKYKPYILDISPIKYSISNKYGGYIELGFGDITVSPELFADAADWPPNREYYVSIDYYDGSSSFRLMDGSAHVQEIAGDGITLSMYNSSLKSVATDAEMLETGTNYDGNTVLLQRAVGNVEFIKPTRMADESGHPTFHNAYMNDAAANIAPSVLSIADNGSGKVRVTTTAAHGFSDGDTVWLEDNNRYYWVSDTISNVGADTFDMANIDYVTSSNSDTNRLFTSTSDGWNAAAGHCYTKGMFRIHDDGIPITSNYNNGTNDNEFYLSCNSVGEVTISGCGSLGSTTKTEIYLEDIVVWATEANRLNTARYTTRKGTDYGVGFVITGQTTILDMLDMITAATNHCFYMISNELYLVHMSEVFGTQAINTLREHDYIKCKMGYGTPYKSALTTWEDPKAMEDSSGKRVESNTIDASYSSTQYQYGDELTMDNPDVYYTAQSPEYWLQENLTTANKAEIEIEMPITSNAPDICDHVKVYDNTLIHTATYAEFIVRNKTVDLDKYTLTISGEGEIKI